MPTTGIGIRIAEGALASIGASALIQHFLGHPDDKATSVGAKLHYAIVDLHSDTIVKKLSTQRVYKILTARRRSRVSRKSQLLVVPDGSTLKRVK